MTGWRRTSALVGLVALALLHVSAAVHEYQHDADHDVSVCHACSAYNNLEDGAFSHPPSIDIPAVAAADVRVLPVAPVAAPRIRTQQPRAPPVS